MNEILELDKNWLLELNGLHTSWLDPVMFWVTKTELWIPLYLFLIFLIVKHYGKQSWVVLLGVAVTILLADQVTSSFMKPYFARLRPSHDPSLEGLVHLVNGYTGGTYGFASSHAANTFGVALFFWLTFRDKYKWMALLFVWAFIMTYTRIYLGVHYPGDILAGTGVGLISATIGFKLSKYIEGKSVKLKTEPTE